MKMNIPYIYIVLFNIYIKYMNKTYDNINNIVTSGDITSSKISRISKVYISNSRIKVGQSTAAKIVKAYDNRYTNYSSKYSGKSYK